MVNKFIKKLIFIFRGLKIFVFSRNRKNNDWLFLNIFTTSSILNDVFKCRILNFYQGGGRFSCYKSDKKSEFIV